MRHTNEFQKLRTSHRIYQGIYLTELSNITFLSATCVGFEQQLTYTVTFGCPYTPFPVFSTPAVLVPRFPVSRFQSPPSWPTTTWPPPLSGARCLPGSAGKQHRDNVQWPRWATHDARLVDSNTTNLLSITRRLLVIAQSQLTCEVPHTVDQRSRL